MAKDDISRATTGRDAKGRFIGREKQGEAAQKSVDKLGKSLQRQQAVTNKLAQAVGKQFKQQTKGHAQQMKQFNSTAKAMRGQIKFINQTAKVHAKTTKAVMRGMKQQQKGHERTIKAIQKQNKEMAKASRAASRVSGGGGIGMPGMGIIGTVISVASGKMLADYVEKLGRLRGEAQALYNLSPSGTPVKRISEFMTALGGDPRTRLLAERELQGIIKLQQRLTAPLGHEAAAKLTTELVGSMETMEQLSDFAAMAGKDIEKALEQFGAADPAAFLTALRATKQEMGEVNKTAQSFERIWHDIKDAAERFVVDFVGAYGGDIRTAVGAIGDKVVEVTDKFRKWLVGLKAEWQWLLNSISMVNKALNTVTGNITNMYRHAWETGIIPEIGLGGMVGQRQKAIDIYSKEIDKMLVTHRQLRKRGMTEQADALEKEIKRLMKASEKLNLESAALFDRDILREVNTQLPKVSDYLKRAADEAARLKQNTDDVGESVKKLLSREQIAQQFAQFTLPTAAARVGIARSELAYLENIMSIPANVQSYVKAANEIGRQIQAMKTYQQLLPDTESGRLKILQTEQQIKQAMLDQVQVLRKLKIGWVQSLAAQSFGIGAYSKLLITQEQNLGIAHRLGAISKLTPSYFVGALERSYREPTKWGMSGDLIGSISGRPNRMMIPPKMPATIESLRSIRPQIYRPSTSSSKSTSGKPGSDKMEMAGKLLIEVSRDMRDQENTLEGASPSRSKPTGQHYKREADTIDFPGDLTHL